MKKVIALMLSLLMVLSSFGSMTVFAASTPWDGTTKTAPTITDGVYQISNGAELAWFADEVNTQAAKESGLVTLNAVLTDDIDLGSKEWTPISNTSYVVYAYAGTFDGQGHSISHLKVTATKANYGLFGLVNGATIQNLKVQGSVTSNNVVGGIVGKLQTGTVSNCSFDGSISTTGTSTKGYVGGLIGTVGTDGVNVTGCVNTADITGAYAGGILGYSAKKNTVITSCYNTGAISGTSRSGGIAGQQSSGTISYCYSIDSNASGIVGFSNATITNCYNKTANTAMGGTATAPTVIGEMNMATLLTNLNAGATPLFVADSNNVNSGYPILNWQATGGVVSVPVTTVNLSGDYETGATLTAQALGENDAAATNVTYAWSVSDDNETFTAIDSATAATYTIPDTADYVGKYIKVTVIGEDDSTASKVTTALTKSATLIAAENAQKVADAKKALTISTAPIKTADSLSLPATLGDCAISWASDNESIIAPDGTVTLPDSNIVTVTLTATITCGAASDTKAFSVDVWSENIEPEAYLQNILNAMKWNFSSLQPVCGQDSNIIAKFQSELQKRGYDGVSITLASTDDEGLINQNGKITYPAKPASTFADGKQVKVYFTLCVGDAQVTYPEGSVNALLVPWDNTNMQSALQAALDAVATEDAIKGDNASLDSIASDLSLPSYIEGDRHSAAQITWESSDTDHLAISNENREGSADAFYKDYVGKVYRDDTPHTFTLTATATNPATGITATKSFTVTVTALTAGELNQELATMQALLDCYTADKLKDFATKAPLDTTAVSGDIQLVIPKEVVSSAELAALGYGAYWDYWNYRFSVTSNNTDVAEINGWRAYIYRPLGESAASDVTVTLTVKMESKTNPNLSVTKDIPVTVKHLTRAELNDALALMDAAKARYADGLLGNNTDVYSIIDDLNPYQEIVWNANGDDVEFIRSYAERRNNGIIVDTLPDWEAQEDWRLFRTSDKDLIANETLRLQQTPDEDTAIKIDSVLTDETFGKYYTKFKNSENYDAEALAKFEQLYKQPVSAYMVVTGDGNYTQYFAAKTTEEKAAIYEAPLAAFKQQVDKPITVTFTVLGLDGAAIVPKVTETSFTGGATVFDVFRKVLSEKGILYRAKGSYISSINGLSEFDYGSNSGWMYTVGKVFVNSYMNAQTLKGGEDIVVMYVRDYTLANSPSQTTDDTQSQTATNSNNQAIADASAGNANSSTNNANSTTAKKKATKKANTLTVKGKTITLKAKDLKKKNKTFALKKGLAVSKAQGTVTYAKTKGNKKITINKKTGKITVKKGLKKGTYKVKIKVSAAGNKKYKAGSKTVTVTVKVK